jgi:hypothetical protein
MGKADGENPAAPKGKGKKKIGSEEGGGGEVGVGGRRVFAWPEGSDQIC